MDGFLSWFFAFMTNMLQGIGEVFSGIFFGIVKTFNIATYVRQFSEYAASFTLLDWIFSVLAVIIVLAIWVLIFYMLSLLIRKYLRFRKSIVGQEDILEELADMHRQVLKLTAEKDRIMALKVSQLGMPMDAISEILHPQGEQAELAAVGSRNVATATLEPNPKKQADAQIPENAESRRFFRLSEVDDKYESYTPPEYNTTITLSELCDTYRNFACSRMRLYYSPKTIRLMFAGLASTKLILLQGISGTGKTSLPYSMGKFFQHDATIASVQPSWRDRTELFGYFNEFTKKFNETEVLRRIYEASYNDDVNVIILDEMNIARVEYYFAEMLSILEMPDPNEWHLDLVPNSWESDPKHLSGGKLSIPQNLWYIGTANNDDSTFAVSDKVYDRALVINLDSKGEEFEAPMTDPININYNHLEQLYKEAVEQYPVSKENLDNIGKLDIYIISKFRIAFGNRIMKQMKQFVPVYVACGGTELEGIDYILATKVFRKFESLNLSLIRDEIKGLIIYLEKMFGKGSMAECIAYLERLQKMF